MGAVSSRAIALATLLLGVACATAAPRAPAVRGMPEDDRSSSLSAVWIGHATVLLRFGNRTVLADPNLGGALLGLPRITPASVTAAELPPIDVALLSHMHMDHFDAKTLRRLGVRPAVFFPRGGEAYADEIAQPYKKGLAPWESVEVAGLKITAVPSRHQGGRFGIDFLWNHAFTGYVIEGAGRTVYFAGDTGYDPVIFKEIGRRFPDIDLACIPIAPSRGKAPDAKDRWGHVGPELAVRIFQDVGAKAMLPIHYEAYFSAGARIDEPRRILNQTIAAQHLEGRVFPIHTGERLVVPGADAQPFALGNWGTGRQQALAGRNPAALTPAVEGGPVPPGVNRGTPRWSRF